MQGKVALINENRGMVAAYTEAGDFSVFHVEGEMSLNLHDVITGELDTTGSAEIVNETGGCTIQVDIKDAHDSLLAARRHLGV